MLQVHHHCNILLHDAYLQEDHNDINQIKRKNRGIRVRVVNDKKGRKCFESINLQQTKD